MSVIWNIACTLLLSYTCMGQSLTCRDASQASVDWWLILKLPHGSQYVYIDSSYTVGTQGGFEWLLQSGLNSTKGNALAETLQPLYSGGPGYVMYNDEWPNGTVSFHLAHAKGVLGFEQDGGFWLVHSAPKFPDSPSKGAYTGICCQEYWGQLLEGQNFMCVTMGPAALNDVAMLLRLPSLFLYEWQLPLWSTPIYPAMARLVSGELPGVAAQNSQKITSSGGELFTAFAKATTPLHGVGVYEDVIEPYFRAGMEVQSWLNGRNALPSQCPPTTQYESLNVRHVFIRVANRGWDNTVDHSKWAVSIPSQGLNSTAGQGQGIVCFGDMNRMEAQLYRGGGAMCFLNNTAVWQTFRALIFAIEGCHNETNV